MSTYWQSLDLSQLFHSYLLLGSINQAKQKVTELADRLGVTFYDRLFLEPDLTSGQISIALVRSTIRRLFLPPINSPKTICFLPANQLSQEAAIALLKTIEEPPQSAIFFLQAEAEDELPATLVSRCQLLRLPNVDQSVAAPVSEGLIAWQAFAQLPLNRQLLVLSDLSTREQLDMIIDRWLLELRLNNFHNPQHFTISQRLLEAKRLIKTTNVNRRLIMEHWLITSFKR